MWALVLYQSLFLKTLSWVSLWQTLYYLPSVKFNVHYFTFSQNHIVYILSLVLISTGLLYVLYLSISLAKIQNI